jgi:peroxiredoxin
VSLKRHIREMLGQKRMSAPPPGEDAPAITLESVEGQTLNLAEALKKGPAVVAFFKVSCPTCQFTAPFLERLHETYAGDKFTMWGISQNDAADTREFFREFDVEFPALIDADGYPVSNRYGITNVPTIFLISPDGKIQLSSVGFAKSDLEKIAAEAARATGATPKSLFRPSEIVPEFKPG